MGHFCEIQGELATDSFAASCCIHPKENALGSLDSPLKDMVQIQF